MSDVRHLSRRHLIQGAGIGAATLTLAACASSDAPRPSAAADRSADQKSLRVDSWETYRNTLGEDFPLVGQFAGVHGVDTTYSGAVKEDNQYLQQVRPTLKAGNDIGADAVVLSSWMVARWLREGWVQEFTTSRMPNVENIRERFVESAYDPSRRRSLPWRSGFTGLVWNKEHVPEGLSSVSQLWDAQFKGRVGALSSMASSVGLIMMDQGVDIEKQWGEAEFSSAVDVLRSHVVSGHVTSIKGNRYLEDLKAEKTIVSMGNSADIFRLVEEAGDKWGFALPDAGGVLWTQDVVIPIGSARRTHVENFVNFYYDPTNAAHVAAGTHYISPVDIREQETSVLDAEVAANRMVFPSPVTLQQAKTFRHLNEADEKRYLAQFQTVLLAAS